MPGGSIQTRLNLRYFYASVASSTACGRNTLLRQGAWQHAPHREPRLSAWL
jgi:hypothetical protein